jgi:hypothetical protein
MPILSNKWYDFLKWFITIFLPAVGALYFALSEVWGFSNAVSVNGTINAIILFTGLLLAKSTKAFNKTPGAPAVEEETASAGDLIVAEDPDTGERYLSLGVKGSVDALVRKEQVRLNVVILDQPPADPPASR